MHWASGWAETGSPHHWWRARAPCIFPHHGLCWKGSHPQGTTFFSTFFKLFDGHIHSLLQWLHIQHLVHNLKQIFPRVKVNKQINKCELSFGLKVPAFLGYCYSYFLQTHLSIINIPPYWWLQSSLFKKRDSFTYLQFNSCWACFTTSIIFSFLWWLIFCFISIHTFNSFVLLLFQMLYNF